MFLAANLDKDVFKVVFMSGCDGSRVANPEIDGVWVVLEGYSSKWDIVECVWV